MKNLMIIIVLAALSGQTFAADKRTNKEDFAYKATMGASLGLTSEVVRRLVEESILIDGAEGAFAVEGAVLLMAGASGYYVGSIFVKADEIYLKGATVSKTGKVLAPVFRKIYNLTHDDKLPEVLISDDGEYKVIKKFVKP